MNTRLRLISLLALVISLAACGQPHVSMNHGAINLQGDQVVLHVKGAPDAVITTEGSLRIDDRTVPVTPVQRVLLKQYHHHVQSIYEASVDVGMAGIIASIKHLLSGFGPEQDHDEQAMSEQTGRLDRRICQAERGMHAIQGQLARELPAFRPYASVVETAAVASCAAGDQG